MATTQTTSDDGALTQMLVSVVEGKRKVVTSYKRKVNLENQGGEKYETAEFFASVEDYVDGETSPEDIAQVLATSAFTVKSTCLEQLGLTWETSEDGMAMEILAHAFGAGVKAQADVGPAGGGPVDVQQPSHPVSVPDANPPYENAKLDFKTDKAKLNENRAWAAKRFLAAPDEFYDNRADKPKPTSFDYRHKDHKIGIWEDDVTKARQAAS